MAKNINHLQHVKSSVVENGAPKLPTPSVLVEGELAVNYAADYETISLKNSSGDVVTFSSDNYYSEKKLGSWFIGENSGKTVTDVMRDDERIIAAALNDLKENKLDASAYTETDLSDYATKEWVGDRLGSGFTGENSGVTVTKVIEDDERAIAAALTDLDDRKLDVSAFTESVGDFYTKEEVDEKLGADFSGTSYEQSVTEVISEIETVTAAALNDLNDRKLDASAYTPTDLSDYATEEWVNDRLGSGFTDSSVTEVFNETEEVIAEALADLDSRISGNTTYITQVNAKADTIARSLSGYTPSGYSYSKGEVDVKLADKLDASAYTPTDLSGYYTKQEIDEDKLGSGFTGDNSGTTVTDAINLVERVASAALNDLNTRKLDASAYTPTDLSGYYNKTIIDSKLGEWFSGDTPETSITEVIRENELAISSALNDLEERKLDASAYTQPDLSAYATKQWVEDDVLGSGFTGNNSGRTITEVIEDNELITSAALNDLNERLVDVEENQLTPSSFKTINNESIIGSGNIEIQGGGGEMNVITGVSVNGTPASVSNKVANITSVPASIVASSSTRTFVTSTEKTKIGNSISGVSLNGTTATVTNSVAALTGVATTSQLNAHTGDSNVHVTTTEKSTWNGKQNHLINENVLSGISSTDVANWNNAISGVSFNGTDATITNGKAAISAETGTEIVYLRLEYDNSAGTYKYDGTDTVLTADQIISLLEDKTKEVVLVYTISIWAENVHFYLRNKEVNVDDNYVSYKFSNVIQWTQETTPYQTFYQLRGINILHPTNTTPTTIYTSLDNFNLTPNTSFTAHTADTTAHVTSAEKSTWNGKQDALSNASVLSGITSAKVTQWDNAISGVSLNGTAATVTNHVAALTGVATTTALNTHTGDTTVHVTAANKTQWNNAISGVSLNGTAATVTNHVAALTDVATTANVSTHSGTTIPSATSSQMHLPTVTAADNGKILMVVNGQWALVNPTTIYTGTGTPSSGQGNDGDIYLQTS